MSRFMWVFLRKILTTKTATNITSALSWSINMRRHPKNKKSHLSCLSTQPDNGLLLAPSCPCLTGRPPSWTQSRSHSASFQSNIWHRTVFHLFSCILLVQPFAWKLQSDIVSPAPAPPLCPQRHLVAGEPHLRAVSIRSVTNLVGKKIWYKQVLYLKRFISVMSSNDTTGSNTRYNILFTVLRRCSEHCAFETVVWRATSCSGRTPGSASRTPPGPPTCPLAVSTWSSYLPTCSKWSLKVASQFSYSMSTNFRVELIEPSAREVLIFWTLVDRAERRRSEKRRR